MKLTLFIPIILSINLCYGETIKIGTYNYPPYSSNDMDDYGLIPAITDKILTTLGYSSKFLFTPKSRTKHLYTNQQLDGISPIFQGESIDNIHLTNAIIISPYTLFKNSNYPKAIKTINNIDVPILVIRGDTLHEKILDPSTKIIYANSISESIKMLCHNRVKLSLLNKMSLMYLNECGEQISEVKPLLYVRFYTGFRDKQLSEKFNKELYKLQHSEYIDKLLEAYGIDLFIK